MKKIFGIFVLAAITLLTSCSRQMYTGNGALSDVSLQRNSSEYEIKRLNEIEVSGKSFWGIPSNSYNANKNKKGMVVRFNGLELGLLVCWNSTALPISLKFLLIVNPVKLAPSYCNEKLILAFPESL